jgi:hypothetical protein
LKITKIVVFSNIILLIFIFFSFLLPFFLPEPWNAGVFRQSILASSVFFVLVLLAVNLFYAANGGLLRLLEKEDWPALACCLEKRTIERGRYSPFDVQLLVNTYTLLSDNEALSELENKVIAANFPPAEKFILLFGSNRLVREDYAGAVRFFDRYLAGQTGNKSSLDAAKPDARFPRRESVWIFWYSGLALFLNFRYANAAERFSLLARLTKEPVTAALSAWFLGQISTKTPLEQHAEFAALAEETRGQIRRLLPKRSVWDKKTKGVNNENYLAAISPYLQNTADWLYNPDYIPDTNSH